MVIGTSNLNSESGEESPTPEDPSTASPGSHRGPQDDELVVPLPPAAGAPPAPSPPAPTASVVPHPVPPVSASPAPAPAVPVVPPAPPVPAPEGGLLHPGRLTRARMAVM